MTPSALHSLMLKDVIIFTFCLFLRYLSYDKNNLTFNAISIKLLSNTSKKMLFNSLDKSLYKMTTHVRSFICIKDICSGNKRSHVKKIHEN